jgi:hypothetical protein
VLPFSTNPEVILKLLTPREREIVKTEYDTRLNSWRASLGNRCPHLAAHRRMIGAASLDDALDHLKTLERFFAPTEPVNGRAGTNNNGTAVNWIMCRNCNFRIMCPHVRERMALEAKAATFDVITTRLARYALKGESTAGDVYFCRICSEALGEVVSDSNNIEALGRFGSMGGSFRRLVWRETMVAAAQVRFPTPVDSRVLARAAAGIIAPLLQNVEQHLSVTMGARRRATTTLSLAAATGKRAVVKPAANEDEEEIDPRTELYATLFVYAYFLSLVHDAPPNAPIHFAGAKPGAKIGAVAEVMLDALSASKGGLLSRMSDISPSYLTDRFREAFRSVRAAAAGESVMAARPEEEFAQQVMTAEPAYQYIVLTARLLGALPRARARTPDAIRKEFETALGRSLPDIVKHARLRAKMPQYVGIVGESLVRNIPADTELDFLYRDPNLALFAKMYTLPAQLPGKFKQALSAFHQFMQKASAITPDVRLGYYIESYQLFTDYVTKIRSRAAANAYASQLARVRAAERFFDVDRAYRRQVSVVAKPLVVSGHRFKFSEMPITTLFDEDGRPHAWSPPHVLYVYNTSGVNGDAAVNGVELILSSKDMLSQIAGGKLPAGAKFVDYQCPTCGVRRSGTGALDVAKTKAGVALNIDVKNFFQFFEARCPVTDLHEFGADSRCVKCGVLSTTLHSKGGNNDARHEYYAKYISRFEHEKDLIASESIVLDGIRPVAVKDPSAINVTASAVGAAAEAEKWTRNYNIIIEASEYFKVPIAAIEALGNMERRTYEEVLAGNDSVVDAVDAEHDTSRILAVGAELRTFLADWNLLRVRARAPDLPARLADVIAAAGLTPADLAPSGTLYQQLPATPCANYIDVQNAIFRKSGATAAVHYLIETLCVVALAACGNDSVVSSAITIWPCGADGRKLSKEFGKKEFEYIMRNARLVCKPGAFNFAIFNDDAGDIAEDLGLDDMEEEQTGTSAFSYEGMDYDGINGDTHAGS